MHPPTFNISSINPIDGLYVCDANPHDGLCVGDANPPADLYVGGNVEILRDQWEEAR